MLQEDLKNGHFNPVALVCCKVFQHVVCCCVLNLCASLCLYGCKHIVVCLRVPLWV
jgi:hypothetical protein